MRSRIEEEARRLGFARVGFAPAGTCRDRDRLAAWLAAGRHGDMAWMARDTDRRTDAVRFLPGARTVIALLTSYYTEPPEPAKGWVGRISRYAWGSDYHSVTLRRVRKLARFVRAGAPDAKVATAVDSRPILEKEWAERAGLGWIGKHTNLITRDAGSWFFVSEIVTDLELAARDAPAREHCGRCTDCLTACPTGAIVAPWTVDARRCISYLTIECKGPIDRELRPLVGEWIFGCDVCQDVCPWNRFAVPATEPRFGLDPARFPATLEELLGLDPGEFERRFRGSAVRRAGRDGFVRNVCIALGNRGDPASVPALARALRDDGAALVRGHAAWALGRIGDAAARDTLAGARDAEVDPFVRAEIAAALDPASGAAARQDEGAEPWRSRPSPSVPEAPGDSREIPRSNPWTGRS